MLNYLPCPYTLVDAPPYPGDERKDPRLRGREKTGTAPHFSLLRVRAFNLASLRDANSFMGSGLSI